MAGAPSCRMADARRLVAVVRVRRVVCAPGHASTPGAVVVVVPAAHGGRRARHGEPLRSRRRGQHHAAGCLDRRGVDMGPCRRAPGVTPDPGNRSIRRRLRVPPTQCRPRSKAGVWCVGEHPPADHLVGAGWCRGTSGWDVPSPTVVNEQNVGRTKRLVSRGSPR
jgi:hypothetical protein